MRSSIAFRWPHYTVRRAGDPRKWGTGPRERFAKVQAAAQELESAANGAAKKATGDGVTAVRIEEEPTFRWSDWLWQGSHGAVAFVAQMVAVLCLVYFMLAAGDLYKRKLIRIVPTLSNKKLTVEILAEIDRQIERFLLTARVVISLIVSAVVCGIGVPSRRPGGSLASGAMLSAVLLRDSDRRAGADCRRRRRRWRSCRAFGTLGIDDWRRDSCDPQSAQLKAMCSLPG